MTKRAEVECDGCGAKAAVEMPEHGYGPPSAGLAGWLAMTLTRNVLEDGGEDQRAMTRTAARMAEAMPEVGDTMKLVLGAMAPEMGQRQPYVRPEQHTRDYCPSCAPRIVLALDAPPRST